MIQFVAYAVFFCVPVLLKAYLLYGYEFFCSAVAPTPNGRLILPVLLALWGFLIFVLEGVQSSVILANKQSLETLREILASIDLSNRVREWTKRALSGIIGGAPIDGFIIGRQLLIIAFAFLFKFSYDWASLTAVETAQLRSQTACMIPSGWIVATYAVLDHWLFSTFLCAVLVAYFFQVPSKLMAQQYPMRFLTRNLLTLYSPLLSRKIGTWSTLGVPIAALRERGRRRQANNQFSYFYGKEISPVSTQDVFDALANLYGEYVSEVTVTLCPQSPDRQDVWFVKDDTTYEIVKPSREFSQAIQVPHMTAFRYDVFATEPPGGVRRPPLRTNEHQYTITPLGGGTTEVLSRVYARFDSDQPVGSLVVWEMSYLTPVLTKHDGPSGIPLRVFDIHVKKPVEKVVFRVAGIPCEEPNVEICPVDGAEAPTCGRIERQSTNTAKAVVVHYPSIGSRLEFRF
jgi:hypothetical protein